jgi:hypothetical protein
MTIDKKLLAVTQAYSMLADANRRFVDAHAKDVAESFRSLIDQRALVCEDLELLSRELIAATEKRFQGSSFSFQSIVEVVRALPLLAEEFNPACGSLKDALTDLVESDKLVETYIAGQCDQIKQEIARVRKGAQGIKGYRHVETYGSCFINKIK